MEKFDLENFPTSKSARRMLSYVSDGFYEKSYVGKWIYQVMGTEYDSALAMAEDLPLQFFPERATWGLMYHEIKWGLPVRENLSYEERRRLIYQKRDYRAPMTPYRMEEYLKSATGFEVKIADISAPGDYGFAAPHPNVFKVYFITGEETLDSGFVHEILNRLKQSHTTYTINDRIEIVVDNRKLEQFMLRRIHFECGISFWGCYIFDGSWKLDGSVMLFQKRRYDLMLGIKYKQWGFTVSESARLITVSMWAELIVQELINTKLICHFEVKDICKANMKAGLRLHAKIDSNTEDIKKLTVTTKTKDYWFFNGSVDADGSRLFNSIYLEEIVE